MRGTKEKKERRKEVGEKRNKKELKWKKIVSKYKSEKKERKRGLKMREALRREQKKRDGIKVCWEI